MRIRILTTLAAILITTTALADEPCQLGTACPLYYDLLLPAPYVGTYYCYFSAGDMEDASIELKMFISSTISTPSSLILSRGPNSQGKNSGELKITKNPAAPQGSSLENAISISAPLSPVMCDETKPNTCNVPMTVTCTRIGD